jgi:hypothetical protein
MLTKAVHVTKVAKSLLKFEQLSIEECICEFISRRGCFLLIDKKNSRPKNVFWKICDKGSKGVEKVIF